MFGRFGSTVTLRRGGNGDSTSVCTTVAGSGGVCRDPGGFTGPPTRNNSGSNSSRLGTTHTVVNLGSWWEGNRGV